MKFEKNNFFKTKNDFYKIKVANLILKMFSKRLKLYKNNFEIQLFQLVRFTRKLVLG